MVAKLFEMMLMRKEGNVLFNDTLGTFFYLQFYGIGHMFKDHSDKRTNLLPLYLSDARHVHEHWEGSDTFLNRI